MTPTPETLEQLKTIAGFSGKAFPPINDQVWAIALHRNLCYAWGDAIGMALLLTAAVLAIWMAVHFAKHEGEDHPAVVIGAVAAAIAMFVFVCMIDSTFHRLFSPEISTIKDIMRALK